MASWAVWDITLTMEIDSLLRQINLESEVAAIAIVALAVALILLINRDRIKLRFREWRIQRCLNRIGSAQIRDLVCADGLDGYYRIDRLALAQDAVLLISYKPYGGNIYCAERISEWTQVIGQKSFKFANPLFELENQLTALRLLIGNVPLRGYLFFGSDALFPKGHPESVLNPETIPVEYLARNCKAPKPEIQAAWDLLQAHQQGVPNASQVSVKT